MNSPADKRILQLIDIAKTRMAHSYDPAHEISHVTRVVAHIETLCRLKKVPAYQREALLLAAWWHDVSRTITRNPSLLWMPLCDDLLSALLLWRETIRYNLFGSVAGLATRIIFCKSMGIGRILQYVCILPKHRILVDMLRDADTIDLLHTPRMNMLMSIADTKIRYRYGYRIMIYWFLINKQFFMKTQEARHIILEHIQLFITWFDDATTREWHKKYFGNMWVDKRIQAGKKLYKKIQSHHTSQ